MSTLSIFINQSAETFTVQNVVSSAHCSKCIFTYHRLVVNGNLLHTTRVRLKQRLLLFALNRTRTYVLCSIAVTGKRTAAILEFYFRFRFRSMYGHWHTILHLTAKLCSIAVTELCTTTSMVCDVALDTHKEVLLIILPQNNIPDL